MDFSNTLFQVDANASLDVADDAAVKVGSLSGSGTVDLEGTGAANDTTSLTAYTPVGESDQFTGSVDGLGQFALAGNGTLTLGGIDFGDGGAVARAARARSTSMGRSAPGRCRSTRAGPSAAWARGTSPGRSPSRPARPST